MKKIQEELEKLMAAPKALANCDTPIDLDNLKFFRAKGCEKCHGFGYKGRIGIYELFVMDPEIEKIILSANVSEYDMQNIAVKQGMITMVQDGILKALSGTTTIDEVLRVAD